MEFVAYLKQLLDIDIKNVDLIKQALTHPSYANEIDDTYGDYERLEFMGDAVLEFLISEYIYNKYKDSDEGDLTVLRAKTVREESLALYAKSYQLSKFIMVGKGERKAGGHERISVQANVFEAVLGAIYLSNGIEDAKKYLKIAYQAIDANSFEHLEDYKTKLQEYVQADQKRNVSYELIKTEGSPNAPIFTFIVKMDDLILGEGTGSSKKRAQQEAAKMAIDKMANL